MIECQELIIKNMIDSKESGFSFKINMGDRLFHLMTDSETDRTKLIEISFYFFRWTTALSQSIQTSKETHNPMGIKLTKNIDLIVSIYDRETSLIARREKLREKIDIDFYKVKDELFGDDPLQNEILFIFKVIPTLIKC